MKKSERGVGTVEILLGLVMIGLIGLIGWYIWQPKSNKTSQPSTTKTTSTEVKTEPAIAPKPVSATNKEYKGKFISFQYPKEWTLQADPIPNVDEFVGLKTPNHKVGEKPGGGKEIKEGASVSIYVMKTTATSIPAVDAANIRGTALQTKLRNGEVPVKDIKVAGIKAIEFTFNFEGDGGRTIEFINNGLFVHAVLDTAIEDEITQPEYQLFLDLLNTVKL